MSWRLDGSYAPEKHANLNIDYGSLTKEIEDLERALAEYDAKHRGGQQTDNEAQGQEEQVIEGDIEDG
jgi:hypothetical protein